MYLYFYPPDSLTHRNKMLNGKIFGPKRLKVQHFNLSLAAELILTRETFLVLHQKCCLFRTVIYFLLLIYKRILFD